MNDEVAGGTISKHAAGDPKRKTESAIDAPSLRPLACKDFRRASRHVNAAVGLAPFELQVAAAEMIRNPPLGPARKHAGHADRAGARSAGECFAAPALPSSLPNLAGRKDFDE